MIERITLRLALNRSESTDFLSIPSFHQFLSRRDVGVF